MTKKTIIIVWLIALALAPFHLAEAQQPGKIPRIGAITGATDSFTPPYVEAGRRALRELGYVEGKNIAIDYRFGGGKETAAERLPVFMSEFIRLKVDIIVAVGDPAIYAAKKATTTIPIVMVAAGDPVAGGLVAGLARPGGNITGTTFFSSELAGKRLELLKEVAPTASHTVVLWNPKNPGGSLNLKETEVSARAMGVTLKVLEVQDPSEFDRAFSAMTKPELLIVLTDPVTWSNRREIVDRAAKHRLPAMYELREFVDVGGLMSYGPSLLTMCERAAYYVDKILKGAKPGDLPVEQPTKFEFIINLKTAKQIGLTIPQSVLYRADKVFK
jgi:putative tryptophan/tyrosine transport system substrate-binding protein